MKIRKILILSALFFVNFSIASELEKYQNTNQMVHQSDFVKSTKKFFGNLYGTYSWENGLVYDQVFMALSGPPDDIQKIEGTEFYLASACQVHNCGAKAAVILSDIRTPVAYAIIHTTECPRKPTFNDCVRHDVMTIFSKKVEVDSKFERVFTEWAESKAGKMYDVHKKTIK